jgi:FxsC-like protein
MAADRGTLESSTAYHPYFVVSYAHLPEIADDPGDDEWVRVFFGDLEAAVRGYASVRSRPIHGFYDQRIPVGLDWKTSLTEALGTAQAFVPLYSVDYRAKSLPGREWACFHQRVKGAGLTDPEPRFMPVLWTPLPVNQHLPWLDKAVALGRDVPAYAKNGLWPMLRIKSYRDSYRAVVSLLARRIVMLAEESPIRPSEVPDIDETPSAFSIDSPLAVFIIETAVTAGRAAANEPGGTGASGTGWRPFPGQEQPLTQLAGQFAERADFQAEVSTLTTVSDPRTRRPGVILIDPLFIADEDGRRALESAVSHLPEWVLPLVILDQPDDSRTRDLARQVGTILSAAKALSPTDSSRRAAQGVSSLNEFNAIMPKLVGEAERQYLTYRSGRVRSQPPSRRPSLRRPRPDELAAPPAAPPDKPASAHDPSVGGDT